MEEIKELKENIRDLYGKHNETSKVIANIDKSLAVIATKMDALPVVKQPCSWCKENRKDIDAHIKEHKSNLNTWKQQGVRILFNLIQSAIMVGGGFLIGSRL